MSMNSLTRIFVAAASLSIVVGVSGCSGGAQSPSSTPGAVQGSSGLGRADWTCTYQPTYNHDWHDDVLCSNGTDRQRPYLREWDSYVTENEIMESARDYEQHLNGG